jgi:hypothetical protein
VAKIIRITRHEPEAVQLAELNRIFGQDVAVSTVNETLPSEAKAAVARFDELAAEANAVEAVLPANLLEAVLKFSAFSKRGGVVVRAVMNRTANPDGSAVFTFDHYERVLEVKIVTERL